MKRLQLNRQLAITLFVFIAGALFGFDVLTPPGVVDGIGYAPVLMLCMWVGRRKTILLSAVLLSVLTVGGFFLQGRLMPGIDLIDRVAGVGSLDIVNRAIAVIAIWAVAALLFQREKVEDEITASAEQAKQNARARQNLLAAMSHELRTPLNAIVGFSELLTARKLVDTEEEAREYLASIHTSALYLLEQVTDLLDFSKLEAGHGHVSVAPTDVAPLVADAVALVDYLARRAGVIITIDDIHIPRLPFPLADPGLATQCLVNLLSNAIKFARPPGRVTVYATVVGEYLELCVADNGVGIAQDDLDKLGKPFVQLEQPYRRSRRGTGLGLAITKSFMELQGGALRITSTLGWGTTVHLSFRMSKSDVISAGTISAASAIQPAISLAAENPNWG